MTPTELQKIEEQAKLGMAHSPETTLRLLEFIRWQGLRADRILADLKAEIEESDKLRVSLNTAQEQIHELRGTG